MGTSAFTVSGTPTVNGSSPSVQGTLIVDPAPDFSLTPSPNSRTVPAGTSATYTIFSSPVSTFQYPVSFSATGLPPNATVSFNPATLSDGFGSTTMTVTTSGVSSGTSPITVTGTSVIGPDTLIRSSIVNLTVGTSSDFALTGSLARKGVLPGTSGSNISIGVEAVNGFNGTVTLGVSGLPTGMTASFSPTSVSGAGAATLTFSVGANTAVGSYPITIAGTSGSLSHSYTMTFNVISKDYSIQPQFSYVYIVSGGAGSMNTTFPLINGFNEPIHLSLSGKPACMTYTFTPNPAPSTSSSIVNMDATNCGSGTVGTYSLGIGGQSLSDVLHYAPYTMYIWDFTMAVSPASLTILHNKSGTTTVSIPSETPSGTNRTVSLWVTNLPANVTSSFSVPWASPSATSTLTINVGRTATPGTYTIQVQGAPGGYSPTKTISVPVTLVIQ